MTNNIQDQPRLPNQQSSLSFTQGLLVGQLSVVLLIGAFIKFFIFGEAPPPQSRHHAGYHAPKHIRTSSLQSIGSPKSSPVRSFGRKPSANNVLGQVLANATDTESILRKTYYQTLPTARIPGKGHARTQTRHSSHQPESLDWFNVLIAQTIAQYRQTAYNMKDASSSTPAVLSTLIAALNDPAKRPSFVDKINVTEVSLGEEYPIFSNCRVIEIEDDTTPSHTGGKLQALMDVDLSDENLTLAIETSLILNYPKPYSAVLPLSLAVSVVRFSGTLSISFVPAVESDQPTTTAGKSHDLDGKASSPKTNLAFSFLPDYRLELSVRSLVGSRSRLQDVPKIAQLVEARLKAWFDDRVVEPRVQVVGLPGLWPRMGKTRVRESEDGRLGSDDGKEVHPTTPVTVRRRTMSQKQGLDDLSLENLRLRASRAPNTSSTGETESRKIPGAMPV